jgi:hypothetical protein
MGKEEKLLLNTFFPILAPDKLLCESRPPLSTAARAFYMENLSNDRVRTVLEKQNGMKLDWTGLDESDKVGIDLMVDLTGFFIRFSSILFMGWNECNKLE